MHRTAPRLLFIPVSGEYGMGEYARSMNLALAYAAHRPDAVIHFLISARAPYAKDMPFPSTSLPGSPTLHTPEVRRVIERLRPDIVVFDNAGRSAQLVCARRAGARLVYISARPRQRRKAFRLRWMRMLDEHWLAYPEFISGPLTGIERLKLAWLKRPIIRHLDCVLPSLSPSLAAQILARTGVSTGGYVLLVPGGGTGHPGATDAVGVFRQAGTALAGGGMPVVLVAPCSGIQRPMGSADAAPAGALIETGLLPLAELIALIRGATAMLTNGGGTLLQAIACGVPTISAAIAADQQGRIATCEARGLTRSAPLNAGALERTMRQLIDDASAREAMRAATLALRLTDASATAAAALDGLLPQRTSAP